MEEVGLLSDFVDGPHTDLVSNQAQQVMGIVNSSSKTSTFSEDVLRLELSGPNHEHLSVVDVPGIFKRTTEGRNAILQQIAPR